MLNRNEDIINDFRKRAEKGDGQFAIAFALMQIAETSNALRNDLCFGATSHPGALEKIGIELADIAKAVTSASDSYTER